MNVVFFEMDGVLNNEVSKTQCCTGKGCDRDKIERLNEIFVSSPNTVLILVGEWAKPPEKHKYLVKKLSTKKMTILGYAQDGIAKWLSHNDDITVNWILISSSYVPSEQDKQIEDFNDRYIHTKFEGEDGGLQDSHVEEAIKILNSKM